MARTTHSDPVPTPAGSSVRRRRPLLFTLTALGAVTGLLGLAGVFATGSDRATTGQNDAITGDLPSGATVDLELASATYNQDLHRVYCEADWSDDLTSGVITSDGQPIDATSDPLAANDSGAVCVRNDGDVPVDLTVNAINVVDTELACSPGEAEAGDTSCGSGVGELSSSLQTQFDWDIDHFTNDFSNGGYAGTCADLENGPGSLAQIADGTSPVWLDSLQPGEVRAFCTRVSLPSLSATTQSDQVSWQYAFDGVEASSTP